MDGAWAGGLCTPRRKCRPFSIIFVACTFCFVQWGGRSSRSKYEHMVEDLLLNVHEQWLAGHDLHEDTLDVFFLEASTSAVFPFNTAFSKLPSH